MPVEAEVRTTGHEASTASNREPATHIVVGPASASAGGRPSRGAIKRRPDDDTTGGPSLPLPRGGSREWRAAIAAEGGNGDGADGNSEGQEVVRETDEDVPRDEEATPTERLSSPFGREEKEESIPGISRSVWNALTTLARQAKTLLAPAPPTVSDPTSPSPFPSPSPLLSHRRGRPPGGQSGAPTKGRASTMSGGHEEGGWWLPGCFSACRTLCLPQEPCPPLRLKGRDCLQGLGGPSPREDDEEELRLEAERLALYPFPKGLHR